MDNKKVSMMIFPRVEDAQNIFDLRDMAKRRLPKWLFEFVDRGTEEEVALRNNREAFERIQFRPRMLVDVSRRKLDTTLYGTAAAGYAGATRALDVYRGEISRGMAQISCNRVSEIGPQHVGFATRL